MLTDEQKTEIINAIKKHPLSMADAAKEAGLAYRTFIYRAQKFGVYQPNPSHKGRRMPGKGKHLEMPIEGMLIEHSPHSRAVVKRKIIREGLLDHTICDCCGMTDTWVGKKLVMHLDHINGVNNDHRIENLRFLCPNCHSQTETYCRKSK